MNQTIEAVVVSVGFGDYLAETLTRNRRHFDRVVVVTNCRDERTYAVAETAGAEIVQTSDFYRDGHPFNKGAGINAGFAACHREGWLMTLDADIVLPADFRDWIATRPAVMNEANRDCLFTARRRHVSSFRDWVFFEGTGNRGRFDLEEAWTENGKPEAIGYFQFFHSDAAAVQSDPIYPDGFHDAGWSDVAFSRKFERAIYCRGRAVFHLTATAKQKHDADWRGRQTPAWPRFGHFRGGSDASHTG